MYVVGIDGYGYIIKDTSYYLLNEFSFLSVSRTVRYGTVRYICCFSSSSKIRARILRRDLRSRENAKVNFFFQQFYRKSRAKSARDCFFSPFFEKGKRRFQLEKFF